MSIVKIPFLAILTLMATPALGADDVPKEQRLEYYAAGAKYGLTMVKAIATTLDTSFPPPTPEASKTQRAALEKALKGYVDERQSSRGALTALQGTSDFLIATTSVTLAATGVGTVPAAIFKASAQITSDAVFGAMEKSVSENLALYLKKNQSKIQKACGCTYEQLQSRSPQEIKAILDGQSSFAAEFNSMVGADPIAKEAGQELVIQGLRNVQKATLDRISVTDKRLSEVDQRLRQTTKVVLEFRRETTKVLKAHEETLAGLTQDVTRLNEAVTSIDSRLRIQEKNARFVNDFIFDKMPPAQKLLALEGGFLSERFECPKGDPNCGGPELKSDLVKKLTAEARIEKTKEVLKTTLGALNDISSISKNLGIDVPALGPVIEYGSAATQAFEAFTSGNYLGAVAAVTGVFGKRIDPDAERFQAMMGYLKQEFANINLKLDQILDNQKKLMDAIIQVSEQLNNYYEALDERLQRMDFEIRRISDVTLSSLWDPWVACRTLYDHLIANEDRYQLLAKGDFSKVSDIYAATGTIGLSAKACVAVGQSRSTLITSDNWFGNFLDIRNAKKFDADVSAHSKGKYHDKSSLDAYIERIHKPSRLLLLTLLAKQSAAHLPNAIELLAVPASSYSEMQTRVERKLSTGVQT